MDAPHGGSSGQQGTLSPERLSLSSGEIEWTSEFDSGPHISPKPRTLDIELFPTRDIARIETEGRSQTERISEVQREPVHAGNLTLIDKENWLKERQKLANDFPSQSYTNQTATAQLAIEPARAGATKKKAETRIRTQETLTERQEQVKTQGESDTPPIEGTQTMCSS